MPNEAPRAGVGEHAIDLGRRGPRIHRHGNHAQPAAGIYQLEVLGFVGEEHGEPVACAKSMSAKRRGDGGDTIVKLSKGRVLHRRNQELLDALGNIERLGLASARASS